MVAVLADPIGCQGLNLGPLFTRQVSTLTVVLLLQARDKLGDRTL